MSDAKKILDMFTCTFISVPNFTKLADCFESMVLFDWINTVLIVIGLVDNHPTGTRASDFFKDWINGVEDIVSRVSPSLSEEIFPIILYPVFERCLRTQFSSASTFKEVFNVRTDDGKHPVPYRAWYC